MRIYFTLCMLLACFFTLQAQAPLSESAVAQLIMNEEQSLTIDDLSNLQIDRQYTDKRGITFIYATQTINGVPIHDAVTSIAISADKKMHVVNSKFIPEVSKLVKESKEVMKAESAVRYALLHGEVNPAATLTLDHTRANTSATYFSSEVLSDHGAKARPMYFLKDNELVLTWDVSYFPKKGSDFWSMRVDASSGKLIDRTAYTVHCQFEDHTGVHDHATHECSGNVFTKNTESQVSFAANGDATYNVFPLPVESPLHGTRQLLVNPHDEIASPFGWHDENGLPGAETTVTEGNNVRAVLARDGNNGDQESVDGGAGLVFDFPYDGGDEPVDYADAATTNLFYMVNMMHDFSYAYGFDEEAGNFQLNNYGNGGVGNDDVNALAQFTGNSGANLNNATFGTPDDGGSGTMSMYLWTTRNDISVFTVTSPPEVAGVYAARTASFGAEIDEIPYGGPVAIADDGVGNGADACQTIMNGSEIAGKVAIIDRGDCEFGAKILNAEERGAIGVIICNNVPGLLGGQMGPGAVGNQVTIPSVFISTADCELLKVHAGSTLEVLFQTPEDDGEPARVDGSLDNGIIAHEFGHGISNRLTGGPDNSNCLNNGFVGSRDEGEQMGEGWSDYFSLVLTVEPGDAGPDPRGIGNYAVRNAIDGQGIRTYPYSTDLSVNPVTYYDTYDASVPHGVGHVWCSMLWDMYWLFVERYGWDADFIHGTGGNNIAIQLVMDGMKLQPCDPGFVDGRDGILMADMMINGGENQDLIWEAFARRGLGRDASQGDSDLVADGKESYDIPHQHVHTVKLIKTMTPNIFAEDDIVVQLEVRNDTDEEVTNLSIIDLVPTDAGVNMSTLPASASVSGDQITMSIASLAANEAMVLTYNLTTPDIPSRLIHYDDLEDPITPGGTWQTTGGAGGTTFQWEQGDAVSGTSAWVLSNMVNTNEQSLFTFFEVTPNGSQPMLRFSHKYEMDNGNDGGVFELSTDYLETVEEIGDRFIRNGYNNNLRNGTFPGAIHAGFTGSTDGEWIDSYVDLSEWIGLSPFFQWRFASDADRGSDLWAIDDFVVFDAKTYNSEACMTFDGSTDMICSLAPDVGTIVEPEIISSTENEMLTSTVINVFPNPATNLINLSTTGLAGGADIVIRDVSGKMIWNRNIERIQDESRFTVSMNGWSAGMYFVELKNEDQTFTEKFVKR